MKPALLLLFVITVSSITATAQNLYTLSGSVMDENNKSIQVGEARLKGESDSALIKTVVITNGTFVMDTTASGTYWLQITAPGFHYNLIKVVLDESKVVPIRLVSNSEKRLL